MDEPTSRCRRCLPQKPGSSERSGRQTVRVTDEAPPSEPTLVSRRLLMIRHQIHGSPIGIAGTSGFMRTLYRCQPNELRGSGLRRCRTTASSWCAVTSLTQMCLPKMPPGFVSGSMSGADMGSRRSTPEPRTRSTRSASHASYNSRRWSCSSGPPSKPLASTSSRPSAHRTPHITLCHVDLATLVERLMNCRHRVLTNPYHVDDER